MANATRYGCRSAEAYCLMLYRDTAGNEEWIWNSRDGVTPFGVRSRQGLDATHVEFGRDRFEPLHEPKLGDRIFVNLTMDRARERRRAFVDEYWDNSQLMMPTRYKSREEAIEQLARADYESFGAGVTPTLVEVTEDVLNIVRSHRPPISLVPRGYA